MFAVVALEVLQRLLIVFSELSDNVLTHITIILLHFTRHFKLIFGWNIGHLSPLSHKVENKLRDIATSDWNVLDGAPDDVSFGARNDMGYAVARIDDGSRECAVCNTVGRPGGGESKYGLDGDVEALNVE